MLTPEQSAVFKAAILANADVAADLAAGSYAGITEWYNRESPDFYVWKTSLTANEIFDAITWAGTGGYIARTAGERECLALLLAQRSVDPSRVNIQQAFADIFSGSATAAINTRQALVTASRRLATNAELLFATGTGTTANPATLTFEGTITEADVSDALRS